MVKILPTNAADAGDVGSIPWVGKIPWSRKWQLTPVFLHGNSMDRGAWQAAVHWVTNSRTQLANEQQ